VSIAAILVVCHHQNLDVVKIWVLRMRSAEADKRRWRACITIEKTVHLGYFATAKEAALAYDEAARTRFGVFASCNLPLQE